MNTRISDLIATVTECCEKPGRPAPKYPSADTVRARATLRQFLREGTRWRSLRMGENKTGGSILQRAVDLR